MRQLKFRAWDKSTNKMLTGYTPDNQPKREFVFVEFGIGFSNYDQEDLVIEQFTGLKDKNGVGVYEGDILQFSNKIEWYKIDIVSSAIIGVSIHDEVENDHKKYPYERRVVELPEDYGWLLSSEIQTYWEVIGNIHKNKELLEGK